MTQEPQTFEKSYSRLEEILEEMNSGALSLDNSLALYTEAEKLIAYCNTRLTAAEEKIEVLTKERGNLSLNGAGEPIRESFTTAEKGQF